MREAAKFLRNAIFREYEIAWSETVYGFGFLSHHPDGDAPDRDVRLTRAASHSGIRAAACERGAARAGATTNTWHSMLQDVGHSA